MSERSGEEPRVFSIPAGAPFLDTLADAFLSGRLFDLGAPLTPEDIAATTIYLPTRRACLALAASLGERAGRPLLLPAIRPLGDVGADGVPDRPPRRPGDAPHAPAIGALDRKLELLTLVDRWREAVMNRRGDAGEGEPFYVAQSPADAFALAGDLAALIDETIIEGVPLSRLAEGLPPGYDPDKHDVYWWLTARFVEIVAARWPGVLADLGREDQSAQSVGALLAEASRLDARPPESVVIAGSTGSVPATARLMHAVSRLARGAVVLPGLDQVLPSEVWSMIGDEKSELPTRFGHPQSMLKRSLAIIGVERASVRALAEASGGRDILTSEVFRPAEASEGWAAAGRETPDGLALVEASDTGEEALAVAFVLREALETPDTTAALVTPDRQLARAVQGELERWGVEVADSAGEALTQTSAGALARLALRAVEPGAGGDDMLALLRHRLVFPDAPARAVDALEIAAMRGRRLAGGAAGLARTMRAIAEAGGASKHDPEPRRRLSSADLDSAEDLANRLEAALDGLAGLFARGKPLFRAAAQAHSASLEALTGGVGKLASRDAEALSGLFDDIARAASGGPDVSLADYAGMFETLAGEITLPPEAARHARLKIWGLLEARLLDADRIVLGGLSEGVWPPEARSDPFLNRALRMELGLQPPERRIGQTAHDFQMLLGHRDVVLTRSRKRAGSPAVASRFLRRLIAWLGKTEAEAIRRRGRKYLDWARQIDRPQTISPTPHPAPKVPVERLPARFSLTEIETLYRDPYAIFARRILRLDALEPVDPPIDARERGTLMHQALGEFARTEPEETFHEAVSRLIGLGEAAFANIQHEDAVAAEFWRRRFIAYAPEFVTWHRARGAGLTRLFVEEPGGLTLDLPCEWNPALSGRADRIEIRADGTLAIIDYKTGEPPSSRDFGKGYAPQLPLTAALAARGAFRDVGAAQSSELLHVKIAGRDGKGEVKPAKPDKNSTIPALAEKHFAILRNVLASFGRGDRDFASRVLPRSSTHAGDYDLLARHLEWSLGGEEDSTEQDA